MPGALRFRDEPIDRAVLADDIMRADARQRRRRIDVRRLPWARVIPARGAESMSRRSAVLTSCMPV
jgi:hypothetical protein